MRLDSDVRLSEPVDSAAASSVSGKVGSRRPSPNGPHSRRPLAVLAAVLTLIGLAVGRFVSTPTNDTNAATPTKAVRSIVAVNPDSIAVLEAAVQRNANDVRGLQQLGVAYTRRAAFGDPSYYQLADTSLRRAEALAPTDPVTIVARATYDLSLHQFGRARTLGLEINRRFPDLNDADAVLVDASVELGHYADAQRYLQELVDRRAALPSYARVSYLRELHGDLSGAATAMQLAINAGQPGSADAASVTTLLGDIQFNLGQLDAATQSYSAARRGQALLPLAELGLARVDAARRRVPQAINRLEGLTARYPLPAAVVLLGDLQRQSGDSTAANASFALVDAIATLQRNAGQVVDLEMAQFALDHQRVAAGVKLAEATYAARPDNVFVADVLAWARYREGNFDTAQRLTIGSLRLGSQDPTMLFHAAAIAAANGHPDQARRYLLASTRYSKYLSYAVNRERDELASSLGIHL